MVRRELTQSKKFIELTSVTRICLYGSSTVLPIISNKHSGLLSPGLCRFQARGNDLRILFELRVGRIPSLLVHVYSTCRDENVEASLFLHKAWTVRDF